MKKFELKAEVVSQQEEAPGIYRLKLLAAEIAREAKPGQFLNIACSSQLQNDPLLRRPLTIFKAHPENGLLEVIYKVKGHGTTNLANLRAGERLDVLGPLGKGFTINPAAKKVILVSGGMGVASLMTLASSILQNPEMKKPSPYVYALIGAHTQEEIVCLEDFADLGDRIKVRPWLTRTGFKDALKRLESDLASDEVNLGECIAYACGPRSLLQRFAEWAREREMPCQVSLEAHMACGVGACQSCICKTKETSNRSPKPYSYKLVCKDGPVFWAEEIDWNE